MFKIGDFSKLSRVSVKTLRYYDEIGLLKPVGVDRFTRYRYYSAEQLPLLHRTESLHCSRASRLQPDLNQKPPSPGGFCLNKRLVMIDLDWGQEVPPPLPR